MNCPNCTKVELEQRPPWVYQRCPECNGTWKTDYLFAYWTGFSAGSDRLKTYVLERLKDNRNGVNKLK